MAEGENTDRRVARTRAALSQALIALIRRKGYTSVTVDEICAEANVGRSTFYAHFHSKDALKRHGIDKHLHSLLCERQRQAFASRGASGDVAFAFSLDLFEHAADNLDLYRALVAKGGSDAMLAMLRDMVSDLTRKELAVQDAACSKGAERELAVKFVVGAFMAVLTSWMDRGAQLPAQKVDAIFKRFILHGVLPAKQCADA